VLIGFILLILFRRIGRIKKRLIKTGLSFLVFVLPFLSYFIAYPIYEGDFSNNYSVLEKSNEYIELEPNKLIVISIANCPYCYDAMGRLKKMKSRIRNMDIEYRVCSSDSNSLSWYEEQSGDDIEVLLSVDSEGLSKLANGRFPTFVLLQDQEMFIWSNDNFGVAAMDEVEAKFMEK